MNGFQYYINAATKPEAEEIARKCLSYALDPKQHLTLAGVTGGPDDGNGFIVTDGRFSGIGYFPKRQAWKQQVGDHRIYVGMDTDRELTPNDVRRADMVPGEVYVADNGSEWMLPKARLFVELESGEDGWISALPRSLALNGNGTWHAGDVKQRYKTLWQYSSELADSIYGAAEEDGVDESGNIVTRDVFTDETLQEIAVECLCCNYRVRHVELHLIGGVFDMQLVKFAINTLIDLKGYFALIKKKLDRPPACSSSSTGHAQQSTDEAPAIDLQSRMQLPSP